MYMHGRFVIKEHKFSIIICSFIQFEQQLHVNVYLQTTLSPHDTFQNNVY